MIPLRDSAFSLSFEGTASSALSWRGYAIGRLQAMLRCTKIPIKQSFFPASGVEIQIYTHPNRIHIKAGVLSPMKIHGYLIDSSGSRVTDSEFVIYKGDQPTVYMNPITLTDLSTLANSTKYDLNGTPTRRYTFTRYNKCEGGYVFFGGPADPITALSGDKTYMGDAAGRVWYAGKEYTPYVSGGSTGVYYILDAMVVLGTLHILWISSSHSSTSDNCILTYSKYTVGNTTAKTDIFTITAHGNKTTGLITIVGDNGSSSATLYSKNWSSLLPSTATQYSSYLLPTSPYLLSIRDARFNPDCSLISILTTSQTLCDMKSGLTGSIYRQPYVPSTSDVTTTFGGPSYFYTNIDIVLRPKNITSFTTASLVTNAYTENVAGLPITYHEYTNQTCAIKWEQTAAITTHSHWSEVYPTELYCTYINAATEGQVAVGHYDPGPPPTTTTCYYPGSPGNPVVAETLTDIENNIFGAIVDGWGNPAPITWLGGAYIIWNSESTTIVDNDLIGTAYRNSTDGLVYFTIYRYRKQKAQFEGSINSTLSMVGTYYCGYSFDIDSKSPTYKSRTFVEMGNKTDISPTYLPSGLLPTDTYNFVSSISLKNNASIEEGAGNIVSDTVKQPLLTSEITGYFTNTHITSSVEVVGDGGVLAEGIYVGTNLLGYAGVCYEYQKGVKRIFGATGSWKTSGTTEYFSFDHVESYIDTNNIEADLTKTIPPRYDFISGEFPNMCNTPILLGHFNYDLKTGTNYFGVTSSTNFPIKNTSPPSSTYSTWGASSATVSDHKRISTVSKTGFCLGNKYHYESASEFSGSTIANTVAITKPAYITYSVGESDTHMADYQIILPSFIPITNVPYKGLKYISGSSYASVVYTAPLNTTIYNTYQINAYTTTQAQGDLFVVTGKNNLGADETDIVAVQPVYDTGLNSTNFPTKYANVNRSDVTILSTGGAIVAQTKIFPNGTNPNTPDTAWRKRAVFGVTGF